VADTLVDCAAIQRDFDRLEKRAGGNLMKFKTGKVQSPAPGNNLMQQCKMVADSLERSFAEKDLCVILNDEWTTNQQCTLTRNKVNSTLGCMRKIVISR